MSIKINPSQSYPVLPLRDIVVFPHMIVPLFVGRNKSVQALDNVVSEHKEIMLVTQKTPVNENPAETDLHRVGTLGTILQMLKLPDGTVKVLVEGKRRAKITEFVSNHTFFEAFLEPMDDKDIHSSEMEALHRALVTQFEEYVKLNKKLPPEVLTSINGVDDVSKLADTIASHLTLELSQKQEILEAPSLAERMEKIFGYMEGEIGVLQVEKRIRTRVKRQMEKTQREYYLNEQMKAIQKELNEGEDGVDEIGEIEAKAAKLKLTKEAKDKVAQEVKKLRMMSPMSAEATVIRNYLDWVISVPWKKRSRLKRDVSKAEEILNNDHFGLEKVKERILEYLAVQQRTNKIKGPILCLVGPPGVGKTSLAQSIARATNRNYVRMALGGVRDESEIRGHRRTYIGALPGKIVQGMKKAGTSNPLFLLDEIDKLASDWRGDPSSALLEVLDPEQNSKFNDHYMELDYDLSDVMFVCTANSLNMPRPLMDRMEVIRLSGYTEDEKLQIAKRHLLTKQIEAAGLKKGEFEITDEAVRDLIRYYTREAGVRNLERELANLARKAVKEILTDSKKKAIKITPDNLGDYAGVRRHRFGAADKDNLIGHVNGLAYTETGGDLLSIEAVIMPGKDGTVSYTGNLKDVMKESIRVAEMLIKSRAHDFGIDYKQLMRQTIHVHVPEGAVPKDGPSAGAAMVTAIVSAFTQIKIRRDVAMTGEINLRGYVTAIGGLKEKLLAALRGGVSTVLIPQENEKDLAEIPDNVKEGLKIIPLERIEDVLKHALEEMPDSLPQMTLDEVTQALAQLQNSAKEDILHH